MFKLISKKEYEYLLEQDRKAHKLERRMDILYKWIDRFKDEKDWSNVRKATIGDKLLHISCMCDDIERWKEDDEKS